MTPRELVAAQIDHQETDPIPYSLAIDGSIEEQLDEHYGSKDWRERIVTYINGIGHQDNTIKKPLKEGYEQDVFGTVWRIDRLPFHLETPGMPEPTFEGYEFPSLDLFLAQTDQRKADAMKVLADKPDYYTTISMGWGLFEQMWGIRGFENALMDVVVNEEFVEELLDRLTELYLAFVAAWADVPADAIMFGDDWGDQRGVLIGPDRWRKLFKPRWAKIYDATHATGKKVISHCCGSVREIMDDIVEIGLDVLESCQPEPAGMNPYELKKHWGDKITFWGCLGSQSTLQFGSPEQIGAEVAKLRRRMGKGGGYILEPAKALQPGTPLENAVAVFEAFTQ